MGEYWKKQVAEQFKDWSQKKNRMLFNIRCDTVHNEIPKKGILKLLDVGCGDEEFLQYLDKHMLIESKGIDDREGLVTTKRVTKGTAEKLPYPNSTFDVVTMMAVIEHIEEPTEVFNEVNRVLKKGGLLIITTPSKNSSLIAKILAKLHLKYEEGIDQLLDFDEMKMILEHSDFKVTKTKKFLLKLNQLLVAQKTE